jgi:hypothetical protein
MERNTICMRMEKDISTIDDMMKKFLGTGDPGSGSDRLAILGRTPSFVDITVKTAMTQLCVIVNEQTHPSY